VLGVDGISDFNALHSREHEVQLYAFDMNNYAVTAKRPGARCES
jgi:hypothetical protein